MHVKFNVQFGIDVYCVANDHYRNPCDMPCETQLIELIQHQISLNGCIISEMEPCFFASQSNLLIH